MPKIKQLSATKPPFLGNFHYSVAAAKPPFDIYKQADVNPCNFVFCFDWSISWYTLKQAFMISSDKSVCVCVCVCEFVCVCVCVQK